MGHSGSWSEDHWNTRLDRLQLSQAYQEWVRGYVRQGWSPYILSLMFHQLPGNQASILRQMHKEIDRFYSRLPTQFHRNPRSPVGFMQIPRMIFFPDLPVFKWEKKNTEDVSINGGLHYQGIALTPPISRFKSLLNLYIDENQDKFLTDKLSRIVAVPITETPDYVADYIAKTFKRGRVSSDDIIILPRAISEMPTKSKIGSRW